MDTSTILGKKKLLINRIKYYFSCLKNLNEKTWHERTKEVLTWADRTSPGSCQVSTVTDVDVGVAVAGWSCRAHPWWRGKQSSELCVTEKQLLSAERRLNFPLTQLACPQSSLSFLTFLQPLLSVSILQLKDIPTQKQLLLSTQKWSDVFDHNTLFYSARRDWCRLVSLHFQSKIS